MIHILKICLDGEGSKHSWILLVGYFCTLLQMHRGTNWWYLSKLHQYLPCDLVISLPRIYQTDIPAHVLVHILLQIPST